MNKRRYVKENFHLVEGRDCEYGCKIRIFNRNNGIGELPEELKKFIYDVYPRHSMGDIHWTKGNCDKGVFDAVLVIHSSPKYVDVYVCGILRRPFTQNDFDKYNLYFTADINYRLTNVFDNHNK